VGVTGNLYYGSDRKLKDNIKDLDNNFLSKLTSLNPKSYYFKREQYTGMSLPGDLHYGLIAQDVFRVFPNLVATLTSPAIIDTAGHEKFPATTYQSINYLGFIPILIQSVKELNGKNDSLKDLNKAVENENELMKNQVSDLNVKYNTLKQQNDNLKSEVDNLKEEMKNYGQLMNECCKNNNNSNETRENKTEVNTSIKIVTDNSVNNNKTELYQNKPNPFKTITTFSYLLGTGGFVELEVTDQSGNLIEKLINNNQEPGNYSIDWDSYKVASGLYYYSLNVNGLMLVKKAIKVN
jgi:hypothetical protein